MKKVLSSIIALGVAVVASVSSVASAAFNSSKDPNGDGSLNLGDSVFIQQYLAGKYEPSNLEELDVDDNDVVSIVDSTYVQMYDAGVVNMASMEESNAPDAITATQTSRQYVVYNAQTGAYKRSYSLSVTDIDNTVGTNQIIGNTDDRIPNWSNKGTAKIMSNQTSAGYRGTGFVVGKHTIATAAHVVFNTKTDYAYSLSGILLFDEDKTWHSFTPKEYHIPTVYKNASDYTTTYDYALITVEEDLSDYMSYNLGAITNTAVSNNLTIATVGFPQYLNPQNSNTTLINSGTLHDERLSTGSITSASTTNFNFNADTSEGHSGAPIYAVEILNGKTYYTVVGINVAHPNSSNQYNIALRFNAQTLKFFNGNSNIQY